MSCQARVYTFAWITSGHSVWTSCPCCAGWWRCVCWGVCVRGVEADRSAAGRKLKTGRDTPSLGPDSGEPETKERVGLKPSKQKLFRCSTRFWTFRKLYKTCEFLFFKWYRFTLTFHVADLRLALLPLCVRALFTLMTKSLFALHQTSSKKQVI